MADEPRSITSRIVDAAAVPSVYRRCPTLNPPGRRTEGYGPRTDDQ